MTSRATQAELLEQRIAENRSSQEVDLVRWIFDRVPVRTNDQVLELCCGTGGQTLQILKKLGQHGRVYALDISDDALQVLQSRAEAERSKLVPIHSSLSDLSHALQSRDLQSPSFDLVFCAYGLYYSSNSSSTLEEVRSWLKSDGRIVIVGPFGPNNKQLFDLVRASGSTIPEPVIFSSERFMAEIVVPWAATKFASTRIHTMVNPVRWSTPERVLNYWKNSTFYSPAHEADFEKRVRQHFSQVGEFVNEKWVMLVEMFDGRF